MALWLSLYTTVNSYCKPKSPTKPLSQIASFTAYVVVMYSALVVDKAIVDCKVAFQLITLPHKVNTYSAKDFFCLNLQHNQNQHNQQFPQRCQYFYHILSQHMMFLSSIEASISLLVNGSFQGDPYIYLPH